MLDFAMRTLGRWVSGAMPEVPRIYIDSDNRHDMAHPMIQLAKMAFVGSEIDIVAKLDEASRLVHDTVPTSRYPMASLFCAPLYVAALGVVTVGKVGEQATSTMSHGVARVAHASSFDEWVDGVREITRGAGDIAGLMIVGMSLGSGAPARPAWRPEWEWSTVVAARGESGMVAVARPLPLWPEMRVAAMAMQSKQPVAGCSRDEDEEIDGDDGEVVASQMIQEGVVAEPRLTDYLTEYLTNAKGDRAGEVDVRNLLRRMTEQIRRGLSTGWVWYERKGRGTRRKGEQRRFDVSEIYNLRLVSGRPRVTVKYVTAAGKDAVIHLEFEPTRYWGSINGRPSTDIWTVSIRDIPYINPNELSRVSFSTK